MSEPSTQPAQEIALLPGMAIVAVWMLVVCAIGLFGVVAHHFPYVVTVLCAILAAGARGLLQLRRWGWAVALATSFLSVCYGIWAGARFHQAPALVLIMVNLVLFLYLVRPEVIQRVR